MGQGHEPRSLRPRLLRARFPEARIEVRSTGPVSSPEIRRLTDGSWSIYADVTGLLDVADLFVAEHRLRERLTELDRDLVDRLVFDSEAEALSVVGASRDDLSRVAEDMVAYRG